MREPGREHGDIFRGRGLFDFDIDSADRVQGRGASLLELFAGLPELMEADGIDERGGALPYRRYPSSITPYLAELSDFGAAAPAGAMPSAPKDTQVFPLFSPVIMRSPEKDSGAK